MRYFSIIFVAGTIFVLSSCHGYGKRGNGHVTTENREVQPFTKITVEGLFPVEITQTGEAESVKVETDENLQSMIIVKTEGDELVIKTDKHASLSKSTKMKVYINIKSIDELDFKSVGALSTGNLKLDSLSINSESVGKLNLDLTARYLHADLESVGSTVLSGNVYEARINNKSVGGLSAFDLKTKVIMIHNASVGVTEVYADSAFYIRSESVGALYYKGPGQVKELKSEGIGRVQKQD